MNNAYPLPGAVLLQRFTVKDVLSCGGTAVILKCRDQRKNRFAVVKRFFPDKLLPELTKRIRTEPFLPIRSEFVAKSEETFSFDGCLHSVQPLIEGKPLSDILVTADALSEKDAAFVGLCLGNALEAVHSAKILSTDVKPDNVIITPEKKAVLIDLAAFEEPCKKPQVSLGTPPYSAPELLQKQVLFPSTDIFSVGMLLFHALIGQQRFEKLQEDGISINKAILSSELKHSCPRLWNVLAKATHQRSAMRQRTARELIFEISSVYSSIGRTGYSFCLFVKGQRLKIPPGIIVIGRDILCPQNLYVNKEQFALKNNSHSLEVLDFGKTTNTTLNGAPLPAYVWTRLRLGDVLGVAEIKAGIRSL